MDEKRVIATIKKVMPAVVSIMIEKRAADLEKDLAIAIQKERAPQKKRNMKVPRMLVDGKGMVEVGGGSGFLVDRRGIVLTNKHVLADPDAHYVVICSDGRKWDAEILSRDPLNDIAIVRIVDEDHPAILMGDAAKLELGTSVIAIGNALGMFQNTVSMGIISGLSRSIVTQPTPDSPLQEMRGLIQTDAAINLGNSGGPLVNLRGEAVGVNVATVFGSQNISFAIPIDTVRRDLLDIKKYGRIRRPLLGVRYLIVEDHIKDRMRLIENYGALISREGPNDYGVVPESPAEKAGLKEGDIILEFNGARVDKDHPIQDFLEVCMPGDKVTLLVRRGDTVMRIALILEERKQVSA